MDSACGVIDTACTVHDNACIVKFSNNFEKGKSYEKLLCYAKQFKNACGGNDTACKIWHRMHDRRKIRSALAAFKGNIYQKRVCIRKLSYPASPLPKYINLKGLPNKEFSSMRGQWHCMHDFCVRKSIISRRIQNRISKDFSPWIRGPGGIVWWKNPEVENLVTLSLKREVTLTNLCGWPCEKSAQWSTYL
jgi:hypothetical protein